MNGKNEMKKGRSAKQGGKVFPALCSIFGILILISVILTCLPLTVPRWFGYRIFCVETGSMSPEIPQYSVIYVKDAVPEDVLANDIIAFSTGESVVVHRVVQNRVVEGKFITKGDANPIDDPEPVPYRYLIGKLTFHIPVIGRFLALYTSNIGKLYVFLLACSGLMFLILSGRLRPYKQKKKTGPEKEKVTEAPEEENGGGTDVQKEPAEQTSNGSTADLTAENDTPENVAAVQPEDNDTDPKDADPEPENSSPAEEKPAPEKQGKRWWKILIVVVLLVAFLGSGGALIYYNSRYSAGRSAYSDAAERYTSQRPSADTGNASAADPDAGTPSAPETPPIVVDFAALREVNRDVVGWIYCPDTPINYPVLQGENNDTYLHRGLDGKYLYSGAIFVDSRNSGWFLDLNTIIYGHNMLDDSMFSCLDKWSDQTWYEAHPVIWLLTPEHDYRIELFSGHKTDPRSDCYDIFDVERDSYVQKERSQSDFTANGPVPEGNLVLLSTCADAAGKTRYVLHGVLVPVD